MAETSLEHQVRSLIAAGRSGEAKALVQREADAADAWACVCLADWKLSANGMKRDCAGAVALLRPVAESGVIGAKMRLAQLLATGTGCDEDPDEALALLQTCREDERYAAAQCAVLESDPDDRDVTSEQLDESLPVTLYRNVLSERETSWLRTLAEPHLKPSFVEEPGTGRRIPHPVRTSSGMSYGSLQEDLVINRINRRIARLSATEYCQGEPLHILRYAPGEQYRPHHDALPGVANQRIMTAILYLNAGYGDGETVFPELTLKVRGREGDMLLFGNVDEAGGQHPLGTHAGLPVTAGEKWIATRWIRQTRYHPWS